MEVELNPGHIVLDGDPASPKGYSPSPIFDPCLLWPNGWMDQDATWYRIGVGTGDILDWHPATPMEGAQQPPIFGRVYCGQTVAHLSNC